MLEDIIQNMGIHGSITVVIRSKRIIRFDRITTVITEPEPEPEPEPVTDEEDELVATLVSGITCFLVITVILFNGF